MGRVRSEKTQRDKERFWVRFFRIFRVFFFFFFKYFRSNSGFSIKPNPIKTRFGFKKPDPISYYINRMKKPDVIGAGRVSAGLLPSLLAKY